MGSETMARGAALVIVVLAMFVTPPPALAAGELGAEPTGDASPPDAAREEEQALERAEAEKLRRMREEQETRRRAAARKLEAEQARQSEIGRLRTTVMGLEQRESTLHHEVRSIQQQLGGVSRDPSDHSAVMRRNELERQLGYSQNQLDYATRSRQGASRQLDDLRFRY
jgi:chromosome segregation ATPase